MQQRPPKNLLTHVLTAIGWLTDAKTRPGAVFTRVENRGSKFFERLARNETFLKVAGTGLDLGFMLRRSMTASTEAWLHLLRAPTVGDVQAMRTQIRQLGDRLEVTQTQLELALAALERVEAELRTRSSAA
jgi:hypothetical protein